MSTAAVYLNNQDFTLFNYTCSAEWLMDSLKYYSALLLSSSIEVKRTPIVKLSQKQRKKLLAETGGKEVPYEPVPVQSPWAVINVPDCSLADIMKVGSTLSRSVFCIFSCSCN